MSKIITKEEILERFYKAHGETFDYSLFEYNGIHNKFTPDQKCNYFSDETAGELFEKTMKREREIKDLGYNLVSKWENL